MRVVICGPNLNDQSKGTFHVHAADCADLARGARREPEYRNGWEIEAASQAEVAGFMYQDHITENEGNPPYDTPEAYVSDFHFFPCVSALSA